MLAIPFNFTSAVVNTSINNGFTWGDTMNVTFCGISIVFLMIILLCLIIKLFGLTMDKITGSNVPKKVIKAEKRESIVIPSPNIPTPKAQEDEDEIIAVISTAVAALYEGTGTKAVVKSIKRSDNKAVRNNWATAGLLDKTRAF